MNIDLTKPKLDPFGPSKDPFYNTYNKYNNKYPMGDLSMFCENFPQSVTQVQSRAKYIPEGYETRSEELVHNLLISLVYELYNKKFINIKTKLNPIDYSTEYLASIRVVKDDYTHISINQQYLSIYDTKFSWEQVEYALKKTYPEYLV